MAFGTGLERVREMSFQVKGAPGMLAFGIRDSRRRVLFAARDRPDFATLLRETLIKCSLSTASKDRVVPA